MHLLIRNARVIDPASAHHEQTRDVLVRDGMIVQIGNGLTANGATIVAAEGLCVSTGWVDVFADYAEPGFEQKETIASGLAAAAAGGFTDVFLVPNTNPVVSTKTIVESVKARGAGHVVTLHPLGAATQNTEGKDLAEMLDMRSGGAIAFSDGWKPIQHSGLMLNALEYVKAFHGIVLQVPTDSALASGGLMNEGIVSTRLGVAGIPAIAETMMVYRDIELARYTGSRLHLTGVSTAASVAMVRQAKAEGLQVTCSVTPYHLSLTDDALITYDSIYKVNPPLRTEQDRQALIAALADGTIDCIASHHHPQEWDAKTREFEYASNGIAMQESVFSAALKATAGNLTIDRLVEAMTLIPRDIFGLGDRVIAEGQQACLTIFTGMGTSTLQSDKVQSRSRNNPFIGKELPGKVIGIVNNKSYHLNN